MAYTTINKPSDYFNTVTYTGDGTSSNAITGVGFQPDFLWIKERNAARQHQLMDVVRGASVRLQCSSSNAETASALNSFDSDGFDVNGSTLDGTNRNTGTYVAWNWLADNTSGSSNSDGSITSTVSANTTSGFSIVSYTGNQTSSQTVGHGLGVKPKMIIVKNRTSAVDWPTWHQSLNTTSGVQKFVKLNTTDAQNNGNVGDFPVEPTSSTFSIGNFETMNKSGDNIIAYCFADVKGYSKFGSYIGNASTDGPFVYTGFKPAFVITKNASSTQGWYLLDNKRNPSNDMGKTLFPQDSAAEFDYGVNPSNFDMLSNGFKIRQTGANNVSGETIIYMAFAENPLVTTGKVPATAR